MRQGAMLMAEQKLEGQLVSVEVPVRRGKTCDSGDEPRIPLLTAKAMQSNLLPAQ